MRREGAVRRQVDRHAHVGAEQQHPDAKKPPAPEPRLTQIFIPASGVASSPAAARTAPLSFNVRHHEAVGAADRLGLERRPRLAELHGELTSFTSFLFSPGRAAREELEAVPLGGQCDAVTITEPAMSLDGASSDSSITGVVPAPVASPAPRQKASRSPARQPRVGTDSDAVGRAEPSNAADPVRRVRQKAFGARVDDTTSSFAAAASALSDAASRPASTPGAGNAIDAPCALAQHPG